MIFTGRQLHDDDKNDDKNDDGGEQTTDVRTGQVWQLNWTADCECAPPRDRYTRAGSDNRRQVALTVLCSREFRRRGRTGAVMGRDTVVVLLLFSFIL